MYITSVDFSLDHSKSYILFWYTLLLSLNKLYTCVLMFKETIRGHVLAMLCDEWTCNLLLCDKRGLISTCTSYIYIFYHAPNYRTHLHQGNTLSSNIIGIYRFGWVWVWMWVWCQSFLKTHITKSTLCVVILFCCFYSVMFYFT